MPAIFSASLLATAREVRASRTWTGLAGSGRMAVSDHRDAAAAGLRLRRRIHGLEAFNLLRGGEYFFLPSLSALRWLGRSTDTCRPISFATRLR